MTTGPSQREPAGTPHTRVHGVIGLNGMAYVDAAELSERSGVRRVKSTRDGDESLEVSLPGGLEGTQG